MFEQDVSILLSTYNGSKFIREQLDSLLAQSYENFIIWVRDDGSKDATREIVEEFKALYPNKFKLVDWESSQNLGFGASFLRLLEVADGDLYFYCDQDDVWNTNKLTIMTSKYNHVIDKTIPCLLHSDLSYIEESLQKNTGFFERTNYITSNQNHLLLRGFLPGCSMAFNKPLKMKCLDLKYNGSHDFLTYFAAKVYGKIELIDEKLFYYRLHAQNTVGIGKQTSTKTLFKDLFKYILNPTTYRDIELLGYYRFANTVRKVDNKLIESEVYKKDEVDRMGYIKRKYWYYNHFSPNVKGILEGLIKLCLV